MSRSQAAVWLKRTTERGAIVLSLVNMALKWLVLPEKPK